MNDRNLPALLTEFAVQDNGDLAYNDPPLVHVPCGQVICTVEAGDSLALLAGVALDHQCSDDEEDEES